MDKATKLDALRLADRLYRVHVDNDADLMVIRSAEAELRRLAVERDDLAARLEALEKQEPVAWLSRNLGNGTTRQCAKNFAGDCFWTPAFPVYAAPTPAPVADEREATAYVTSDGKMLVFADKVQGTSSVHGMEPLFKRSALQPAAVPDSISVDAEKYGDALNEASWAAVEAWNHETMGNMHDGIFNNIKSVVRAAILKYCEVIAATPQPKEGRDD